jgi:hypothetical protein
VKTKNPSNYIRRTKGICQIKRNLRLILGFSNKDTLKNFNSLINKIIDDSEEFTPFSLNNIISFVKKHENYKKTILWAKNSTKAQKYLTSLFQHHLFQEQDIQLSIIFTILVLSESTSFIPTTSSFPNKLSNFYWTNALASSSQLKKEIENDNSLHKPSQPYHGFYW